MIFQIKRYRIPVYNILLFIVWFVKCILTCKIGLPFICYTAIMGWKGTWQLPAGSFCCTFSISRVSDSEKNAENSTVKGRIGLFASFLSLKEDSGNTVQNQPSVVSEMTFDELYEKYATDVLRVAYYYLGDRQRAEDVTQDVFVKLLLNRPVLYPGREKSWLLKVALNKCRDLWRSSWVRKVILGHPSFELFPADDEIGKAADSLALAEAVNHLSPEFKEVVLLHYYQGYSVSEISEMLEVAEGTVSSRLSRARTRMIKELKGE